MLVSLYNSAMIQLELGYVWSGKEREREKGGEEKRKEEEENMASANIGAFFLRENKNKRESIPNYCKKTVTRISADQMFSEGVFVLVF